MFNYLQIIIVAYFCLLNTAVSSNYYGKRLGNFKTTAHKVNGTVYAANQNTFIITGFTYDGQAPDAHFWAGNTENPSPDGFVVPDENNSLKALSAYDNKNIVITLPPGKLLTNIKWLSVWCRKFNALFGVIQIPRRFRVPKEKPLDPLPTFGHAVKSGPIIVKDAKTLFIPQLYYDGAAPDAYFLVGKSKFVHHEGAIKLETETGSVDRIKGVFDGENIVLRFPGTLTVFDVDWFSIYCITFEENFGHIILPKNMNIPAVLPSDVIEARTAKYSGEYYGKPLGEFQQTIHQVAGSVYVANKKSFVIKDFTYDGLGPEVYFWVGNTLSPSPNGFKVPNELSSNRELGKYESRDILLTLPHGWTMKSIRWLSIWSTRIKSSFGHVLIPVELSPPMKVNLGPLPKLAHGVNATSVIIKDSRTISLVGLNYDGAAPDAFFMVGNGSKPHGAGVKVPDETGSLKKIKGYTNRNITLRLPGHLSIYDIEWFALYCITYAENFGHVTIPKTISVPPNVHQMKLSNIKFNNCEEIIEDQLQVSWKLVGDGIYVQLKGRAETNDYLSFGISANRNRSKMVGADAAVAFYDESLGRGQVIDYFLSSKSQCSDGTGVCPDVKLGGTNDVILVSSERQNGILTVVYKRKLNTGDSKDLPIRTTYPVAIVGAIGPLNNQGETAFHHKHCTKHTAKIYFGRKPADHCKTFQEDTKTLEIVQAIPWLPSKINEISVFRAQIGPTGGDKGYTAITGIQSWGIAWWINGLLIPELTVVRGRQYTFILEGGNNASIPASYHPFYITNNDQGGVLQYPKEMDTPNNKIYAGMKTTLDGKREPEGVGRLCEWRHKTVDMAEQSKTMDEYKSSLHLKCDSGEPGQFFWTPDENTPDLVYYQCLTHRNLGWKIHVTNEIGPVTKTSRDLYYAEA